MWLEKTGRNSPSRNQPTAYGTTVIPVTDHEAIYVLDEILVWATRWFSGDYGPERAVR